MQSRSRAFTLVELLVVISIIAILAGLALPAIGGALNSAKKAKATTMISQLKVAITAFNSEYGTWPATGAGQNVENTTLYQILTATEPSATYNTRGIVFMEFSTKDLDNPTTPTTFIDPWYSSVSASAQQEQVYTVLVDNDYDNKITGVPDTTTASGTTTIAAGVAIYDPGTPKNKTTVNADNTKFLKSW